MCKRSFWIFLFSIFSATIWILEPVATTHKSNITLSRKECPWGEHISFILDEGFTTVEKYQIPLIRVADPGLFSDTRIRIKKNGSGAKTSTNINTKSYSIFWEKTFFFVKKECYMAKFCSCKIMS